MATLSFSAAEPTMTSRSTRPTWLLPLGALVALLLLALAIGWTGFIASDDALYYRGATRWLAQPPFAGDDHWSTRFPLILSFAAWLAVLGRGLGAFAATALSWYEALIIVFGLFARGIGGARVGWIAAALAGTMPVIIANATTVSTDLPEATFLVGGLWLVAGAASDRVGLGRALAGGLCFGCAILCRETSLLSLAVFVPLFLIGRPLDRRVLLASAAGIALVIGGEMLFQWALTGDALHRYSLAYHHDEHIDRAANKEGNFLVHPAIDPLLVLLVNDDFGLLFWAAGLALALGASRGLDAVPRRLLAVFACMATADFGLVAVLTHKLVLNPRYFLMPALLAALVTALWAARSRPLPRAALIAGLIAINLLMLSVENTHPRWAAEALVSAARDHRAEAIAADPATAARADLPLALAGLRNVRSGPAQAHDLMLVTAPDPSANVVARYPSPPTRLGAALDALHLRPLVPASIARRLFAPNPEVVLVREPG